MRRRYSCFLFVFLLLPLLVPVGEVYGQLGYITGTVVDEEGNPIKDATIRIEGMTVTRNYKLKTNDKGQYLHAGVSMQGAYRVIAEKEGYVSDYAEQIKPGFDRYEERSTVAFTLRKGQSGKLAFEMTDEERARLRQQAEESQRRAEALEAVREAFDKAVTAFNMGQYEEAATLFEEVIEANDSQAVIWGNLANTYGKLNRNEDALAAYDRAIALDAENPAYLQNKGSVYATMGESEKAREMYEQAASKASTLNPKDAAINYYNMGVTYINTGKNEEAAEALNKALEMDPTHAESRYQLGITLLGTGDMEGAVEQLKKYIELSPGSENAAVAEELIKQLGG